MGKERAKTRLMQIFVHRNLSASHNFEDTIAILIVVEISLRCATEKKFASRFSFVLDERESGCQNTADTVSRA